MGCMRNFPQVGFQRLSIWMRFEWMVELFDCFLECVMFLLNSGME